MPQVPDFGTWETTSVRTPRTNSPYVLRSDPVDPPEPPEPEDLPELDDCPEAGLCGEIWPPLVPVLPALECCVLPVPGPPGRLLAVSSIRSPCEPGLPEPLCWPDHWLPLPDCVL